jgi:hypothetical protein
LSVRLPVGCGHWTDQSLLEKHLLDRAVGTGGVDFAVELQDSQCAVRLLPGIGETIGTLFTWQWLDAARVIGVNELDVLDSLSGWFTPLAGTPLLREVWAAGYLLGRDLRRSARGHRRRTPARLSTRGSAAGWARESSAR